MKFTCPLLVAVGACASMVAFCAELPPAAFDAGGVTFDFDAISARTLGPGTGGANVVKPEDSVLPFEKWRPFHEKHLPGHHHPQARDRFQSSCDRGEKRKLRKEG